MLSQSFRLPFFINSIEPMENAVKFTFAIDAEEGIRWVNVFMNGYEGDSPQPVVIFDKIEDDQDEGVISLHENLNTALQHINQQHVHFPGYPSREFLQHCTQRGWLIMEYIEPILAQLEREKAQ